MYLDALDKSYGSEDESLHEYGSNNDVHGLTVPDFFVNPAVGRQDTSESPNTFLALESCIFWQASVKVFFDFINGKGPAPIEFGESISVQVWLL